MKKMPVVKNGVTTKTVAAVSSPNVAHAFVERYVTSVMKLRQHDGGRQWFSTVSGLVQAARKGQTPLSLPFPRARRRLAAPGIIPAGTCNSMMMAVEAVRGVVADPTEAIKVIKEGVAPVCDLNLIPCVGRKKSGQSAGRPHSLKHAQVHDRLDGQWQRHRAVRVFAGAILDEQ